MKFSLGLAVLASLSARGRCKALLRSDFAQQTSPPQAFQFAAAPEPTAAPQADIVKRQTTLVGVDTCGYINGIKSNASAITCHNTNARCVPDTQSSIMGCCDNTSEVNCGFYSTCLDSTQVTGTPSGDYYRTLWCTNSANSVCRMGVYTDDYFKSYRIYWCHSVASTFSMSYSPPQTVVASTTMSGSTSSTMPTVVVTTVVAAPTVQADPVPAGAIAGGVVGGIAAIGLIALAFFIVIRRGRKSKAENPPAGASPAMYYAPPSQYPPSGYDQSTVGKPASYYHPSPVGTSPPPNVYGQQHHEIYTQPTSKLSAGPGAVELRGNR